MPRRPLAASLAAPTLLALCIAGCDVDRPAPAETGAAPTEASTAGGPAKKPVVAMLPKLINIDYFNATKRGAEKAAAEVGVDLIYDGPSAATAEGQNEFIETWIRQKVDAICLAPNQPKAVKRFVEKAKAAGIKVLTWDTDAPESGRDLMVNQVDDKVLGEKLMDELARQMGQEGKWAIAIASLDAANLNTWRRFAEARSKTYPKMELVATEVTKEDENLARQKVEALLSAHPDLKGVLAFDSSSVPGAAEAVRRAGKTGKVAVVGNSTPAKMRQYVKEGVCEAFFLWDPRALGGLTIHLAKALIDGKDVKAGMDVPGFGKLQFSSSDPRMVILSDPIRFTKDNIDKYEFGI